MKRRVTVTEGKACDVAGLRIEVRRKPRHETQFRVIIEVPEASEMPAEKKIKNFLDNAAN